MTGRTDTGDVYEQVRQAFLSTVSGLTTEQWSRTVPATPAWTVHDVLAHVVGLCVELNALHFPEDDDLGGEAWNQRQVETRRASSFEELRAEWDHGAPVFEGGLRAFGYEFGSHFVADLHAHLHDVRAALGLAANPDPVAVAVSLDHYAGFVHQRLVDLGRGGLVAVVDGVQRRLGPAPMIATVTVGAFELLRTLSARCSLSRVRALDWTGDADRAIELLASVHVGGYRFPSET